MIFHATRIPRCLFTALLIVALLWPAKTWAHYPWIELENQAPASGTAPRFRIGWGHSLPAEDFLKMEDAEEVLILSATGAPIAASAQSATLFAPQDELVDGTYLVAAKRKPGFYTKTTEGGKRQSKKGLDNAVKCSWSTMSAKGIVNVGGGSETVDRVAGHPLEIIPLKNPARLKAGEPLPVRALFHGKPYSGAIAAVHRGDADEKETPAAAITTDLDGRGEIDISAPGVWLLKAQHELPYQQPEECDVESYVATLTFTVR